MTLQQIDNALAAWSNRLAAIANNLLELQAQSTYQLLTGYGGAAKLQLTGATAAKVEPALGAMQTMFQQYDLLHSTIDRATKLRKDLPSLFGGDQKQREIVHLLFEKSIRLPEVPIPLEQRTLLSGVQSFECISVEELLQAMARAFAAARDAVLAVDQAWRDLALSIERTESQIRWLNSAAERSATFAGGLTRLMEEIRGKVQADPFGAMSDLNSRVQPVLARANKLAEEAEKARRDFHSARLLLEELVKAHGDALDSGAEARIKIEDCSALPQPAADDEIQKLREWLNRLEKTYSEDKLDAVAVGMRNWNKTAQELLARAKNACAGNRAPVETRDELRGRLQALKAKARAYGLAENDAMVELARQAEALLYTRPTNLKNASAAVVAYEKKLNGSAIR
jgi:hypothetical protein